MRFLPYIIKNVLRHKLRSAFTVLSIGFSLFLVTLLYAYIGFQDELAARSAQYHRLVLTHRNGLTDLLPAAHLDDVRAIKGVKAATPMSWFGGIYKDDRMSMFAQFATDPDKMFEVYEEYRLPPEQLAAWQSDRTGCIVGRKIAATRGWKIGEKIPLKGDIYDCNLDLTVKGIYDGPSTADLEMLWFHYAYLDELLKSKRSPIAGQLGIIVLKA
ncbi:MAG: ABC transporter permease, partial [Pirellulales bacterium]